MIHELVEGIGDLSPEEVHRRYVEELVGIVEDHGVETVARRSGVDEETVATLGEREPPDLTVQDAAAILALREDTPGAEAIADASRDALLLGMTNAVLDVDGLSAGIGRELEPREIQSKVEGRFPMTLREYALLYRHVRSERV